MVLPKSKYDGPRRGADRAAPTDLTLCRGCNRFAQPEETICPWCDVDIGAANDEYADLARQALDVAFRMQQLMKELKAEGLIETAVPGED